MPVDQVRQDPEQPRKHFDEESLRELGASLRVIQVQPIVVRRDATGWVLVDGERRWRAARGEGLRTLDAREMTLTARRELMTMVIQLAANTHRDQLTLEEQALGVLQLAEGGFPTEAIARVLGYQDEHVVSLLTIARSGDARQLIEVGRLGSVGAWDAYVKLEPAVRKRVLDSTDPITMDRCERARREHEL
ncbi:ParB-like nuclease domain protein, partial [mine drainage metagenome]